MRFIIPILFFATFLFPSTLLAQPIDPRAGTDVYLRENVPNASVQLNTPLPTEQRKPFSVGTRFHEDDPIGDILTNLGTTSKLRNPWGDITGVTWVKNVETSTWEVTITVASYIPERPTDATQITVYTDIDGKLENNSPAEGVRGDMDAALNVKYDDTNGWGVDFRWYNPATSFWRTDRKTKTEPRIEGDKIILRIPFAELSKEWTPRWRVMMAISGGSDSPQVDLVPGAGFPDSKTDVSSVPPLPSLMSIQKKAILVILGIASITSIAFLIIKKRRA